MITDEIFSIRSSYGTNEKLNFLNGKLDHNSVVQLLGNNLIETDEEDFPVQAFDTEVYFETRGGIQNFDSSKVVGFSDGDTFYVLPANE